MPTIVRRQWGPLSVEWVSLLALQHLPCRLADLCVQGFVACFFGVKWWVDHVPVGTTSWVPYGSMRVPVIDKWAGVRQQGGLVQCIKEGRVQLLGQITGADGHHLLLSGPQAGGGGRVPCDVVIFATGFAQTSHDWLASSSVAPMACELGQGGRSVLPPRLFRVGFSHGAALLPLRQICKEAQEVAAVIDGSMSAALGWEAGVGGRHPSISV